MVSRALRCTMQTMRIHIYMLPPGYRTDKIAVMMRMGGRGRGRPGGIFECYLTGREPRSGMIKVLCRSNFRTSSHQTQDRLS